jgi:hypothetical protein
MKSEFPRGAHMRATAVSHPATGSAAPAPKGIRSAAAPLPILGRQRSLRFGSACHWIIAVREGAGLVSSTYVYQIQILVMASICSNNAYQRAPAVGSRESISCDSGANGRKYGYD